MGLFDFLNRRPKQAANKLINICIEDLTAEELRASNLPDDHFNIWVNAASKLLNHYRLIYSTDTKSDQYYLPRVALSSDTASMRNFKRTLNYIRRINQGRDIPQRPIYEDAGEISALVHENMIPFTQKSIADIIEEYQEKFTFVEIPVAYYTIPEQALENSGFASERIKIR